jgi:putative Ca2+/H+ antiporter (TMEM165/GDT1 family)
MDALFPTFIAILVCETGGKVQRQTEALARRHGMRSAILVALVIASTLGLLVSAYGGMWIASQINYQARTLMLGIALLFAGASMILREKLGEPDGGGPVFARSLWRYIIVQFGDNAQFLVFAFAARGEAPLFAASAGVAAVLVAALPPYFEPFNWRTVLRIRLARKILCVVLTLTGLAVSLSALRLI